MTTQQLDPHDHPHLRFPSAIAFLTVAILILLTATIHVPPRAMRFTSPVTEQAPTVVAVHPLPFTSQEVQTFFARKIGTMPKQFGNTTIISQPASLSDTADYEIAVTNLENGGIAVAFRGSGPKAIELAEQFCASPLFQPAEAANLVSMVAHRHEWPSAGMARFAVHVRMLELIDLYQLSIEFTPPL